MTAVGEVRESPCEESPSLEPFAWDGNGKTPRLRNRIRVHISMPYLADARGDGKAKGRKISLEVFQGLKLGL